MNFIHTTLFEWSIDAIKKSFCHTIGVFFFFLCDHAYMQIENIWTSALRLKRPHAQKKECKVDGLLREVVT